MDLAVAILAAGQSQRMQSNKPKVVHRLAGQPLLQYSYDLATSVGANEIYIVYRQNQPLLAQTLTDLRQVAWVEQAKALGTGDAVARVLPFLRDEQYLLVLYGDTPLLTVSAVKQLIAQGKQRHLALLICLMHHSMPYGRIKRDQSNQIQAVIEANHYTESLMETIELNVGPMVARVGELRRWLAQIPFRSDVHDHLLHDVVQPAHDEGIVIGEVQASQYEAQGINSRSELAQMECDYQWAQAQSLLANGVQVDDPHRLTVRGRLQAGIDTWIGVNCVFEGDNVLGENVLIGDHCRVVDCDIGNNVVVEPGACIVECTITKGGRIKYGGDFEGGYV